MVRYSSADLKHIKQVVTMEQVLRHYNLLDSLTLRGQSHRGMCPFCGAGEHLPFSVSLEKNCFQCFLCRASGNVLDFVAKREDLPDIYRAAERIVEVFNVEIPDRGSRRESPKATPERAQANEASFPPRNEPLTFTLKNIDSSHDTVQALGISADVVESFGVGYYTGKGLLHNHIVVPVKNKDAEIIAYIGYEPEARSYTYPPRFHRDIEVFNLSRALAAQWVDDLDLVLVRHPLEALVLVSAGFYNTAAIMGEILAETQLKRLLDEYGAGKKATLFLPAGNPGATDLLICLSRFFFVRLVSYEPEKDTHTGLATEAATNFLTPSS